MDKPAKADGEPAAAAIVKILDLQVFLIQEDGSWIAQAVELDYAACGKSEDEAEVAGHA